MRDPVTAFCSSASGGGIEGATKQLQKLALSTTSQPGKENGATKDVAATALQCLKAAHKQLAQPGADVPQLAALCQSSLRILGAHSGAAASKQAHTAAYTTIRLLVSAKATSPAMEEALRLRQRLQEHHKLGAKSAKGAATLSPDEVNLAVGTLLTLALCWAEGAPATPPQLASILQAAETCKDLFRCGIGAFVYTFITVEALLGSALSLFVWFQPK